MNDPFAHTKKMNAKAKEIIPMLQGLKHWEANFILDIIKRALQNSQQTTLVIQEDVCAQVEDYSLKAES